MAEKLLGSTKVRPPLLTLAVVFATATIVYNIAWMYYVRKSSVLVEIGIDNSSTPSSILLTKAWMTACRTR